MTNGKTLADFGVGGVDYYAKASTTLEVRKRGIGDRKSSNDAPTFSLGDLFYRHRASLAHPVPDPDVCEEFLYETRKAICF